MFDHIEVVIPPAEEPVEIEELKAHVLVVVDDDDAKLWEMLVAAREAAEKFTRRSLITQTIDVWYSSFENLSYLELPRGKVQSIEGLWTYDSYGVESEVLSSTYGLEGRYLSLNSWDTAISNFRKHRGIKVKIVSGYGPHPEDVESGIKQGILEYAAHLYEHRLGESGAEYANQAASGGLPEGVKAKWRQYQLMMV